MLEENKDMWREALWKDLHKASFEADLCEIMFVLNEAKHAHNELDKWMKPEKVRIFTGPALKHVTAKSYLHG